MFKKFALGSLVVVLVSPLFASAQNVGDLQAQIQALITQINSLKAQLGTSSTNAQSAGSACVSLVNSLSVDDTDTDTDGEVTKLQQFLANHGPSIYPEARITGYFGPATMRAVQRWQKMKGIVSSGDPDSTGYGFVGARTRAAMACAGVASSSQHAPTPQTTYVPSTYVTPTSDASCVFLPNSTGKKDNLSFNGQSQTAANCKNACEASRSAKYGMHEGGSCIFTGPNGVGQSVMAVPPAAPLSVGPVITVFVATPSSIPYGTAATISWGATNSSACGISPIGTGTPGLDLSKATTAYGVTSVSTGPLTQNATYELRCAPLSGIGGDYAIKQLTVPVVSAPVPQTPAINFQASSNSVLVGQAVTLSWNVSNANRCVLQFDSSEIGGLPMSGSQVVLPSKTTSYRLWCANDLGNGKDGPAAEKTLSIIVQNPSHVFNGNGVSVNAGPNAVAYMAAVNVAPNTAFTISGTASANGPLTIALVDIKYAGGTDWSSISQLTKDGSGYMAVSNSVPVSGGNWSAWFGGLPEAYYHILIYDASYNLKGSGFLVSTNKG